MTVPIIKNRTADFRCPYCKGTYAMGEATVPGEMEDEIAVIHSYPPCAKFMEKNPLDFAVSAREIRESLS
ncbi:MAG: hypothetical protein ACYDH4_10875 [Candidatus Cryosericum sp.]